MAITFSKLNPLRFVSSRSELTEDKLFVGQRYTHLYQFNSTDRIVLQLITPSGYNQAGIILNFQSRETGREYSVNPIGTGTVAGLLYFYFDFTCSDSGLEEGCYNLRMKIENIAQTYLTYLYCDPIWISDEHLDTVLLQYYSDKPQLFDSLFNDLPSYYLRIPGSIFPGSIAFSTEDEVYLSQGNDAYMLSSSPYRVDTLTAGDAIGIPDSVAETLNYATSCDRLYVDGIRYSKEEGQTWQRADKETLLSQWTINLIKSDNANSDEFAEIPILGSFDNSFDFSFEKYN